MEMMDEKGLFRVALTLACSPFHADINFKKKRRRRGVLTYAQIRLLTCININRSRAAMEAHMPTLVEVPAAVFSKNRRCFVLVFEKAA